MNIGGLERRVTKLERAAGVGQERPIRICFQESWQTKQQALEAAGLFPEPDNLTVLIVKWVDKPPPGSALYHRDETTPAPETKPKTLKEVDSELEQLRSELKKETQH